MGTRRANVILAAENVVDLQFFLMDSAKYDAATGAGSGVCEDLLSNAAALDYALLLSSEHGNEAIDADSAVGISVRATMTKAANAALDFVDAMLRAPEDVFDDFVERQVRAGGLFETLAALRESGVATDSDLAFRTLTLANDLIERRRSR